MPLLGLGRWADVMLASCMRGVMLRQACIDAVSRFFQGRHGGMKAFARTISAARGGALPPVARWRFGRFIPTITGIIGSLNPLSSHLIGLDLAWV